MELTSLKAANRVAKRASLSRSENVSDLIGLALLRSFGPAVAFLVLAPPCQAQKDSCPLIRTVVARTEATPALIEAAEVSIPRLNRSTLTDSIGAYRLTEVACGHHEVQVRKIGFTVIRDTVTLVRGQTVARVYRLISVAQLDTVRTTNEEINYQSPRLQDFEARRKRNVGGHFIGEAELRKYDALTTPTLMRGKVPGLQFVEYRGIRAARGFGSASMHELPLLNPADSRSPRGCWVTVFLDGILIFDGTPRAGAPPPDIDQFPTRNLSGIEYYASAGTIPFQFKTTLNSCGTLLLWTRGR